MNSLVLRYPFDKSAGQDVSKNQHQSVVSGVRLVEDSERGMVAKFQGRAYIKGPQLPAMKGSSRRTIVYWCNMAPNRTMYIHSTGRFSPWSCSTLSGKLRLVSNRVSQTATNKISSDRWYHVCETYDGKKVSLYIDGKLERSNWHTVKTDDDNIYLGRRSHSSSFSFQGKLSDFRVFDDSMSASKVRNLYRADNRPKEIPGKLRLKSLGSTALSCSVEGDPKVRYRVVVDDEVIDDVKTGDTVHFEQLTPGTSYSCKLYKVS